jgi:predicted methyltransferase
MAVLLQRAVLIASALANTLFATSKRGEINEYADRLQRGAGTGPTQCLCELDQNIHARRIDMKIMAVLIIVVALVSGANASDNASNSAAATMAVADPSRPDSDTTRDADRKPAQTLVFVGIKSGDKVADYVADSGYFTRLFASVVGSNGHVYAVEPTAFFQFEHFVKAVAELQGYAVAHPNVTVTTAAALEGLKFPEKLDLFWISRNYHDLHDKFMGPVDTAPFNRAVYEALKPGGFYVVLDHSAAIGAAANVTETLHRIESSTVRREVEAAGFKFDSESSILANPADPRTAEVFDQTIRGHTDQFILKFRKPK